MPRIDIVGMSESPALAPIVAAWLVDAFHQPARRATIPAMTACLLEPPDLMEASFVLLEDNRPVGTASLTREDLETRPDLAPWLAGVFVEPEARGRGHATALVHRVEAYARAGGLATLWLYTRTAQPLYARLGWQDAGWEREGEFDVQLMRRDLGHSH